MSCRLRHLKFAALVLVGAVMAAGLLTAKEPPAPPKISTFAPADDLMGQVEYYLGRLEEALADEADFDEARHARVKKEANTLIVLALNLGMHDQDNPLKDAAPAVVATAQVLAKAPDHASARAALEEVKKAVAGQGGPANALQWGRIASLGQLMKQVPVVHASLKRGITPTRFQQLANQSAGHAATLAAIAQASVADTHEVKDPADLDKWFAYCIDMRDAAGEVNAAIRAGDLDATVMAMTRLNKSCDTCHEVFRPDE
jgi:hypothetical protein